MVHGGGDGVFGMGGGGCAWVWRGCLLAWEDEEMRECTILLLNVAY